jgi:hypothetical protein
VEKVVVAAVTIGCCKGGLMIKAASAGGGKCHTLTAVDKHIWIVPYPLIFALFRPSTLAMALSCRCANHGIDRSIDRNKHHGQLTVHASLGRLRQRWRRRRE